MNARLKNSCITALIAAILALPLAGIRTADAAGGLSVEERWADVAVAALLVFIGRLAWETAQQVKWVLPLAIAGGIAAYVVPFPTAFLRVAAMGIAIAVAAKALYPFVRNKLASGMSAVWVHRPSTRKPATVALGLFIVLACLFPLTPLASRYALDVSTMVLTYVMLAWGLNITVGYAGLLDLGYAGFYAIGAYFYALSAQHAGLGFWLALPMAGLVTAAVGFVLGFPVLRLRGDYFAVVTLGFGEIVRLFLINATDVTGGPNGISGIPRPTFFGLPFAARAGDGAQTFADFFHLTFNPVQRVTYLYYVILLLAVVVGLIALRLRRLPLGRAWEAFREDEIACASIGINSTWIKLAAYSLGAAVAGMAGAFFAARQGFVSPESFTFTESATILAIVILGGIGHPLGIILAAIFIVGLPEAFRGFEQYRMLAFGLGMVLIMVWRPGGLMATRVPTVRLPESS